MPSNIVLNALTEPPIRSMVSPIISTNVDKRGGFRNVSGNSPVEMIFSEDFSSQPLWVGINPDGSRNATPTNWTNFRSSEQLYAPSTGYPGKHETMEIVDDAGDIGNRALRGWREADDTQNPGLWNSDAILTKRLPGDGLNEVYVKFRFKLQPGWTVTSGVGKLFRISHKKEGFPEYGYGTKPEYGHGPMYIWDGLGGEGDYGFRNVTALRGYPNETNYFMGEQSPQQLPRSLVSGNLSLNWGVNVTDLNGDGIHENAPYPSVIDGSPVGDIATVAETLGIDTWVTAEFYFKMNSAPGVADGAVKQWINGHLCFSNDVMPWCASSAAEVVKWNTVSFGGNHYWAAYPAVDAVEEWYVIDDIEIHNGLPEGI